MRCPVCGSSDVTKVRPGEYRCNQCISYFDVSESAWHGSDKSTKRRSNNSYTNNYGSTGNSYRPRQKKHNSNANNSLAKKVMWATFVICVLAVLFVNTDFFKEWNRKRWEDEIHQQTEQLDREIAAKEKMEKLMLVPYYSYKSEFEAQKERVLPINILNIEMNMPIKNLENYKGPEVEEIKLNDIKDRLNIFRVFIKDEAKFFGANPHHFDGDWEDGKLIRVFLYYDCWDDSIVTENVKKWAGKGFYTKYEKNRTPEQTWEYKNVIVKLYRPYSGNDVFLRLTIPGFDYDKLEKEKKDRYEKNHPTGYGRRSASSHSSYSNESSYEKREKWYDEQEEEEYDDEYDEEYGW